MTEISVRSNALYVAGELGKFATRAAEIAIVLPNVAAPPVMGVLMAAIRMRTPIDTAELMLDTDWEKRDEEPLTIEVFSTAQNVRTGYEYAKARAYGFNKVNGEFWTPPEDPPYPVQAAEDAHDVMLGAAKPEVEAAVMAIFAVPH